MSVTAKALIDARFALSAANTEYTTPVGVHTIVDKFTATNTDTGAQTVSVNITPNGQSVSSANQVVQALSLGIGATVDLDVLKNQVLNPGDFINVVASVANKVVIRASGREIA